MTTRQKPELTDAQRAILNSAYDALGANPQDGWFTLEATPQITKAVKDGLLNHRENTKQYRISGKGLWMLGKEHPLKVKQAAIEKAVSAEELQRSEEILQEMNLPIPVETAVLFAREVKDVLKAEPPRTEQEQARADLAGDGKIAPVAFVLPPFSPSQELKFLPPPLDEQLADLEAKADDLERQLADGQTEWAAEKALMEKRIAELEAALVELRAQHKTDAQELVAERDEARSAALKFTELASHWRAINALVEVEVSAPTSPGVYKGFPEPVETANGVGAKPVQPAFGFLDGHNPAGKQK